MNISQIIGFRLTPQYKTNQNTNQSESKLGLKMQSPLKQDTVCFGATEKMLTSRTYGISLSVARAVSKSAEPMQEKVRKFLNDIFGDLLVTELNPMNPIYAIKDRVKTPGSICEKSATRQLNSKSEVLDFMTDLNGAKIVMRDARKKVVEKVLTRLIKPIEKGEIELLEIENKRPIVTKNLKRTKKEQYDYASIEFLQKLQRLQEEKWVNSETKEKPLVRFDMSDYTNINYTAIHFLLRLPGESRPFELMLMGKDVDALKNLDDKLFKILNNKNVDKKYKPLVDVVSKLKEPGNKPILDKFNQYRGEAFLFEREKEPNTYAYNEVYDYFLPLRLNIPPIYDLNNLNRIMRECENVSKKIK